MVIILISTKIGKVNKLSIYVLASWCWTYYSVRVFVQEASQDTERSYPGQRERRRQGKFPGDRPQLSDRQECRSETGAEECTTAQHGDGETAPEATAHVPEPLWSVSDDTSSSLLVSVIEGCDCHCCETERQCIVVITVSVVRKKRHVIVTVNERSHVIIVSNRCVITVTNVSER